MRSRSSFVLVVAVVISLAIGYGVGRIGSIPGRAGAAPSNQATGKWQGGYAISATNLGKTLERIDASCRVDINPYVFQERTTSEGSQNVVYFYVAWAC